MEFAVGEVESDASHRFFSQYSFSRGPIERSLAGIADFVHVGDTLGDID